MKTHSIRAPESRGLAESPAADRWRGARGGAGSKRIAAHGRSWGRVGLVDPLHLRLRRCRLLLWGRHKRDCWRQLWARSGSGSSERGPAAHAAAADRRRLRKLRLGSKRSGSIYGLRRGSVAANAAVTPLSRQSRRHGQPRLHGKGRRGLVLCLLLLQLLRLSR